MTRYRIVPSLSQVWIEGRSTVHPIHHRTDGLEGWIELQVTRAGRADLRTTPSAHVEFAVARLTSSNPLEARELKRRINARHFPTIEGELTAMEKTGENGRYLVSGDVTFLGVTRPHADEMTVEQLDDGRLRLEGRSSFDVRDFGMEPPRILMLRVEPLVEVRVEIVAEPETH